MAGSTVRISPRSTTACNAPQPTTFAGRVLNTKFGHRFIECHEILFQQDLSGIGVDELFDRGHQVRAPTSAGNPVGVRSRVSSIDIKRVA